MRPYALSRASVEELYRMAFEQVGLNYRDYVVVDPKLQRPAEVEVLLWSAAKAKAQFGWQSHTTVAELVALVVDADRKRVRDER